MNTYYLYERGDGRVILDAANDPNCEPIREIKALSWLEAVDEIPEIEFFHDFGHGKFRTPRKGAYPRQQQHHLRVAAEKERIKKIIDDFARTPRFKLPKEVGAV